MNCKVDLKKVIKYEAKLSKNGIKSKVKKGSEKKEKVKIYKESDKTIIIKEKISIYDWIKIIWARQS